MPITKDLLDELPLFERYQALRKYHDWLKSIRILDRKDARKTAPQIILSGRESVKRHRELKKLNEVSKE
mgnify:CR=1 FL=1